MFIYDKAATLGNIANLFFASALWAFAGWRYAVGALIGGMLMSIRRKPKN